MKNAESGYRTLSMNPDAKPHWSYFVAVVLIALVGNLSSCVHNLVVDPTNPSQLIEAHFTVLGRDVRELLTIVGMLALCVLASVFARANLLHGRRLLALWLLASLGAILTIHTFQNSFGVEYMRVESVRQP